MATTIITLKHWIIKPLDYPARKSAIKGVALTPISKGLFTSHHRRCLLEALRPQDIEIRPSYFIRDDRVGPLQTPVKVTVAFAVGSRVESVVDQVIALLPRPNKVRTFVVNLAAKVGHVEYAQVHLLVHCCGAVATPIGARKHGRCSLGQSSATAVTGKREIHVHSGGGDFVPESTGRPTCTVEVYVVVAVD